MTGAFVTVRVLPDVLPDVGDNVLFVPTVVIGVGVKRTVGDKEGLANEDVQSEAQNGPLGIDAPFGVSLYVLLTIPLPLNQPQWSTTNCIISISSIIYMIRRK